MKLRRANERGRTRTDWLDSRHTFSFADYHDPEYVHFGPLRVINEDVVKPSSGFGKHPHHDMEIVTYVLSGQLEHKDSMGNGSIILPSTVQRMSAGTGVTHSEWNPSETEPVHFFQIWFLPNAKALEPSYEQMNINPHETGTWQVLASGSPDKGVFVNQDMMLQLIQLDGGNAAEIAVAPGRMAWIHVVDGQCRAKEVALKNGDAIGIDEPASLTITADMPSRLFWFDVAAGSNH